MNFKIKISEREQWLIFGVVAAVVVFIFFQAVYLPRATEIIKYRQQISFERQELTASEQRLAVLEKLEFSPLEQLRASKTKEEQVIDALRHIAHAITSLNLDLISIRPRPEEKVIQSAKVALFDVNLIGRYNDIYRFMRALEKLPILILVDSMEMKRSDKALTNVNLVLSVYY